MPYTFDPNAMYRMPTHFGPSTGPRRRPDGKRVNEGLDERKTVSLSVSYESNPDQLAALCPPGFEPGDSNIVTVFASYMREIAWLAGRGYAVLGVTFPAVCKGKEETVRGPLLTVLWENLADPIITGREELGFSKIYCELPDPQITETYAACSAGWLGSPIMDMRIDDLKQVDPAEGPPAEKVDGQLHYKYMPRTGKWGTADVEYAVISPAGGPGPEVLEKYTGNGSVNWRRSTWEDLPTQYQVVNGLADLEVREYVDASLTRSVGGGDLYGQRIVR